MEHVDYLELAKQYANFLVTVGTVSITVIALVLNLSSKLDEKLSTRLQRNSRTFLIAALMVATISSFIGTHMMAETAAFISYSQKLNPSVNSQENLPVNSQEKPPIIGTRHFLLASTNIFIAALLVLFALMLLPTASGEKNAARITPISITVFLCLTAAIICWLLLATMRRMHAPSPEFSIGIPGVIAIVWIFILYIFPKPLLLSASFIPISVSTVFSLIYFALTFDNSENPSFWDIFIFCSAIFISYASLLVAGIRIMWRSPTTAQRALCTKLVISGKILFREIKKKRNRSQSMNKSPKGNTSPVVIEQMKLADKAALLDFLREAYAENPRMSDERFWDWHFLENPYVEKDNLPVWIAKSGGRIAGQLAAIPVKLEVGDKKMRAMWILDLIVHKDFRRQGIAKRLVLKSEEFCPVGLGVNTMEQHAPALLQSLGWKIVGKIPRYAKLLFAGNALPEISRINFLRRTINLFSAPFRPRFDKSPSDENGELRVIKNFDSDFDVFWEQASKQFPCAVARDSGFLEWQYQKQPDKKFDIIGYFEEKRLLGYAVLFVRRADKNGAAAKAAITDLCYHPDNSEKIIDELLQGALQLAVDSKAGTFVTDAIDPLVGERLVACGFRRVKNPLQLMVKSTEHQDLLYDAEKWFLTRGDSDISIFEQPNLQ